MHYTDKNFSGAALAFENALKSQPDYANAQYFLGLSYAELRRRDDAIAQFEALVAANPDNVEISLILNNLKSGRSPFSDALPPITPAPEKRPSLPITNSR